MKVKSLSCVQLFANAGSSVHGILQARILEWVAISFSNIRLLCPWNFSRQEYYSWLPFPSPEDLPDSGMEPSSPAMAGRFFTTESPWKPHSCEYFLSFWNICKPFWKLDRPLSASWTRNISLKDLGTISLKCKHQTLFPMRTQWTEWTWKSMNQEASLWVWVQC